MPWEEGAVLGNNFLYTSHRLTLQLLPRASALSAQLLTPRQILSAPADAQGTERLPSARGRVLGTNNGTMPKVSSLCQIWDRPISNSAKYAAHSTGVRDFFQCE